MDQISTDDVVAVLRPIWRAKPATASRVRARIERVLDAAKARGFRQGDNPARWRGHLALLMPESRKLTRGPHAALPYEEAPASWPVCAWRRAWAPGRWSSSSSP